MYLNKLLLKDFGKFNNKEIELKPGVNLIYGPNESGKSTVKDFIVGMFYGIDKSRGAGAKFDSYELRKPIDRTGYSGKAYLKDEDETFLIERSFLRHNKKLDVLNIQTGREVKLEKKSGLQGAMFEMDKNTYVNTLCIGEHGAEVNGELADEMNNYLANLSTTGSVDIDKAAAVARLKEKKKEFDVRPYQAKLKSIEEKIDTFATVDEELADIRERIKENDQEFAMETAKRKREARKLIETDEGAEYEDDDEILDGLDELRKNATFLDADEHEAPKPKKPVQERLWFILLTGLFVVGVITLMVNMLPFEQAVRQLFEVCTVLLVAVTIVEGLYYNGALGGDEVATPTEEDFQQVIYDLKRKTEAYQDVEIDMSFATEYADKKAELKVIENTLLAKQEERENLKAEYEKYKTRLGEVSKEVHAINLAINTIMEVSSEIHDDLGFLINDNISDIVSKITDGKYQDVKLDEKLHVKVWDGNTYVPIEYLSAGTVEQIYLAVRLSVARVLCKDKMPVIIDDIFTSYDESRLVNTLDCLKTIDTEQIILMTSNKHIGDMLDDLDMDYNYVEL